MEGLLFVGLLVVVAGLVGLTGLVLIRTLLASEQDQVKDAKSSLGWRPPFVSGEALRNWAAWATKDSVQRRLTDERTGRTAVRLARDVEDGAVHAMLPEAPQADLERVVPCPTEGQGVFGVTAPEALAIAATLRQTRSRADQQKISELATENARKLATPAPGNGGAPPLPCPLQGENHICCTYAARPLHCLPLHARSVATGSHAQATRAANPPDTMAGENQFESTVGRGVQIGLQQGLKDAGLDAGVYEFNSALAKALDTPDAADRWARGENVFASCRRAGVLANR